MLCLPEDLDSSVLNSSSGQRSTMDVEEDNCSIRDVFLEPRRGFWLRKRKRKTSTDASSVCSLDVSITSEPDSTRKKKRLSKVASFANLLSTPMRPVMKSLQRSMTTGKGDTPTSQTASPFSPRRTSSYCPPTPPAPRVPSPGQSARQVRLHRSWSQTIGKGAHQQTHLGLKETKRQEAIFELCAGEENIVEDLELLLSTYRNSLLQLNILTPDEVRCIFGDLEPILNLHRRLRDNLQALRDTEGVTFEIGQTLVAWIPMLKHYVGYCANQVWARALLDEKKASNKRFQDFLNRCLESSFSRKLELWSFLDVPRSRLVKYPLLVNEILRLTPPSHVDALVLPHVSTALNSLLRQVDMATGAAECQRTRERLNFPPSMSPSAVRSAQRHLQNASAVKCSGILRDKRGRKIHGFLFDTCFVAARSTRPVTKLCVCYPVIAARHLAISDGSDSAIVILNQSANRLGLSLFAPDEHVRKHWIDSLHQVVQGAVFLDDSESEVTFNDSDVENHPVMEKQSSLTSLKNKVMSPLKEKMVKSKSVRLIADFEKTSMGKRPSLSSPKKRSASPMKENMAKSKSGRLIRWSQGNNKDGAPNLRSSRRSVHRMTTRSSTDGLV